MPKKRKLSAADKSFASLAGEFSVTSHLCRMKIHASVTYGASKRSDIIAVSKDRKKIAVIEVKSSAKDEWPVTDARGRKGFYHVGKFWVFVRLGAGVQPNEFYILDHKEVRAILTGANRIYQRKHKATHGVLATAKGVPKIKLAKVAASKNQWTKIRSYLMP